jgi:hypothetical protein
MELKFKYKRNDTCKTCHGHGYGHYNCEVCNGNGVINRIMQTPIGVIQQSFPVIIVMVLVVRLLITVLTVMVLVVKVLKKLSKLYHLGLGKIVHLLCMEKVKRLNLVSVVI